MTDIYIISGFLGAGKTTLIKTMVRSAFRNKKIVVIENDFGEAGIDAGLLKECNPEFFSVGKFLFTGIFVSTLFQDVIPQAVAAGGAVESTSGDDGAGLCVVPLFLLRCGSGQKYGREPSGGGCPGIFGVRPYDGHQKCCHVAFRF